MSNEMPMEEEIKLIEEFFETKNWSDFDSGKSISKECMPIKPTRLDIIFAAMEKERAEIPDVLLEQYIPIFTAAKINEINTNERTSVKSESKEVLTDVGSQLVTDYLEFCEKCNQIFDVDKEFQTKILINNITDPCLEVMWRLSEHGILSLYSYLLMQSTETLDGFFCRLSVFLLSESSWPLETEHNLLEIDSCTHPLVRHYFKTLIPIAYCARATEGPLKMTGSATRVHQRTKEFLYSLTLSIIDMKASTICTSFVLQSIKESGLPSSMMQRYFTDHLTMILTAKSDLLPEKYQEILQKQECYANSNFIDEKCNIAETLKAMLGLLLSSHIKSVLQKCLEDGSCPWWKVLLTVSMWKEANPSESMLSIKEIIKYSVHDGFKKRSEEDVAKGFILARHCSLISPETFGRYEKWYTNIFEDERFTPANDEASFKFFMDMLMSWVEIEPPCFLQAQATFWPYIPQGFRMAWSNYAAISKQRILEYNEIEKAIGVKHSTDGSSLSVEQYVEAAIESFKNNSKVPEAISKDFMFRKKYYLSEFLPSLLQGSVGSDVSSDARLRLIELLHNVGKIPPEMYTRYKNKDEK